MLPDDDAERSSLPGPVCWPLEPGVVEVPGVRGPAPDAACRSTTEDPGLTPLLYCIGECKPFAAAPLAAEADASVSRGPSYSLRMTGREEASAFLDLLLRPSRNVPELVSVLVASLLPSRWVMSRAKEKILLPGPSFFFLVPDEDSE